MKRLFIAMVVLSGCVIANAKQDIDFSPKPWSNGADAINKGIQQGAQLGFQAREVRLDEERVQMEKERLEQSPKPDLSLKETCDSIFKNETIVKDLIAKDKFSDFLHDCYGR